MDKKVILLNGPPNCGKDLASIMLSNFIGGKHKHGELVPHRVRMLKFADPLKQAAHALYGIPHSCEYYEKEYGNVWKDTPQQEFFGEKPRDIYIGLSEEFAKVRAGGELHFGRIAARRIQLDGASNCFIFSDSGFAKEAFPIIEGVGVENVFVFQISRPGSSFAGDSRGNIASELVSSFPKIKVQEIPNVGDKMLYRTLLHGAAAGMLDLDIRDGD